GLQFPSRDAIDVQKAFKAHGGRLFPRGVFAESVLDADATTAGIDRKLDEMLKNVQPDDTFVVFLAGHGMVVGGSYFFLPYDIDVDSDATVRAGGIGEETLRRWLARLPSKALLLVDTCNAGAAMTLAARGAVEKEAVLRVMRTSRRPLIVAT